MDEFMKQNLEHWNEVTPIHHKSEFYDVKGFKAGKSTLMPLQREELGELSGTTLLHLQCHFGLDTMSWARLGAKVTGVDFSDKAIRLARSLSKELGKPVANVYKALETLEAKGAIEVDRGRKRVCRPLPVEEFLGLLEIRFHRLREGAAEGLRDV